MVEAVSLQRRLLLLMFALWKSEQNYNPNYLKQVALKLVWDYAE